MNWRNERNENVVQLNAIQLAPFLLSSYLCVLRANFLRLVCNFKCDSGFSIQSCLSM